LFHHCWKLTISSHFPSYETTGCFYHDCFAQNQRNDCQRIQRSKKNRKVDPPDVATQNNQLPTRGVKKSPTPSVSPSCSNVSPYASASDHLQVDALCDDVVVDNLGNESLAATTATLSVTQSEHFPLDGDLTQKKPHAVGMKSEQFIRPRGKVIPTFEAAGGNYWFQDHDTLLLEYAYQIVGVPLAERWDFSEQEIKDELKMTFPRPPNSG
jgi:hypothetical protein